MPADKRNLKPKLLNALDEAHGIITIACSMVGISTQTYYNWLKDDADFSASCKKIEESTKDFIEYALLKKIEEGDTSAIIFAAKTKLRCRGYSERIDVTSNGKSIQSTIAPINVSLDVDAAKIIQSIGKMTSEE